MPVDIKPLAEVLFCPQTEVWGYTNKACLRRLNAFLTLLVRVGGLSLYSRDFNRQVVLQEVY